MTRSVLAATLIAVAVCLGHAGQAGAQAAGRAEVVSPRPDVLNTTGTVTARVRAPGRVARLHIYLRARRFHDVTRRFRSQGRGLWTAKLRLGRQLVRGRNHLYLRLRRPSGRIEADAVHFTVGRPLAGLLRLSGLRSGAQRAPLALVARAPRAEQLRARLNGRNVAPLFERDSGGRWVARLAAHNALRFGRNRLTVTAFNRRGWYQRIRRRFPIRSTHPLVGAGRDRTGRAGIPLRLNGNSTRATRPGRDLRLRWRIVSRPRGSKAKLRRARTRRPLLRPDAHGRYIIRLRASKARSRSGRAGASAAAPAAVDTVSACVQPDVLPSGVPMTTLTSNANPGIQLGPTTGFPSASYALGAGDWLQMLVLDRCSLAQSQSLPSSNNGYPGTDQGMAQLQADVGQLSSDDLVILSGSGQSAALSTQAQETLVSVVEGLGAVLQPGTGSVAQLGSGQWSLIGIPGLPQGTAYQFIGLQREPSAPVGSMSGFFQLDTSGNFTFSWPPAYQTFDTQAAASIPGSQSAIAVGPQTYVSATVPPGQSAFHVLWLDSGTLALQGQYTALNAESGCGPSGPLLCLSDLASTLQSILSSQDPALLLVATIGKPAVDPGGALGEAWATVAQMLNGTGAEPYALLGLDGTGDYSFVGLQGLLQLEGPNSGTELSQVVTGSPTPRVTGLLERNRQGNWMSSTNGSPAPGTDPSRFIPSLRRILAQPNQGFPEFDSKAKRAAEQYITTKLGLTPDPNFGIRANYWTDQSADWNTLQSTLEGLTPCAGVPCTPCPPATCDRSTAAFETVEGVLDGEFGDVATVNNFFFFAGGEATLYGLLDTAFIDSSVSFVATSNYILSLFTQAEGDLEGDDMQDILQNSLSIASGASGLVPVVGGETSSAITLAAGVEGLVSTLANGDGGNPLVDEAVFQADILEWGTQLKDAWSGAHGSGGALDVIESTAALLVSDAGRLSDAAAEVNTAGVDGGWGLDPQSSAAVTSSLEQSSQQYMWWTMLPGVVTVLPCTQEPPGNLYGLASFAGRWVTEDGGAYRVGNVWPILIDNEDVESLDTTTADLLFENPTQDDPDDLGFQQPYFFAGAWMEGGKPVTPGFVYSRNNHEEFCLA